MRKFLLFLFILAFIGKQNTAYGQLGGKKLSPVDSANFIKVLLNSVKYSSSVINSGKANKNALGNMYQMRGQAELALGMYERASKDCSMALTYKPEVIDTWFTRGKAYEALHDYEHAISDCKKTLLLAGGDKKATGILYDMIGVDEGKLKHFDAAVTADSTALSLIPQYVPAYEHRAFAYASKGKYQMAVNDLSSAIIGYQDNPPALSFVLQRRADMYKLLKLYKQAINDFSLALKIEPTNKYAIWGRASCYYVNADYELANADYTKAILYFKGDNKSMAMLYDDRAQMEMGQQQLTKAIADDSLAIAFNPKYGLAYVNKANSRSQIGDYEGSNADYRQAISFYTGDYKLVAIIYTSIAHNEYFLNNYQKVVDNCTRAIGLESSQWSTYMERGRAYLKLNQKDQALDDFKQVLALDTSKKTSDYAFALFYTGNADKAVAVMQDSFVATTNTYSLMGDYYNMACLLSLMNKADEANIYLKKCIDGGYPKRYAITDGDFDNIRNTDEFKQIIASAVK